MGLTVDIAILIIALNYYTEYPQVKNNNLLLEPYMYINYKLGTSLEKEAFQIQAQSVFLHSVLCYHRLPTSVLSVLPVCVVIYCCTN